jgi:hypothetical protein
MIANSNANASGDNVNEIMVKFGDTVDLIGRSLDREEGSFAFLKRIKINNTESKS